MDFNATIDLIIKDLDEAAEIINDLKKYPGVPILQIELAKSKCKSAGEVISLLKSQRENIPELSDAAIDHHNQSQVQLDEDKKSTASSVISNLSSEEKKDGITAVEIKPQMLDHQQKNENIADTTKAIDKTEVSKDKTSTSIVEKKEEVNKIVKRPPETPIIADKFSHLSSRFNEQLGSQKGEDDGTDILSKKRLSNLSEAIGVNDKFLFIREIFDGNKDEYNKAILKLDNAKNLDDARAIIMSYTDYSEENKAVKQLLSLVKRKLPSNE